MSKIRTLSTGVLCAAALSLAGAFAGPAMASADPGQPWGQYPRPEPPPTHPVYHYTDDLTHPVWSVTHPVWAIAP
ncbi:MAG: hypothetical protein ACLPXZ_22515 [Mycobacterium sp.]